jgi:hypothetical protein
LEILHTEQFANALVEAAESCQYKLQIYSAFIKEDAFGKLAHSVANGVSGSVVARWRPSDLFAGVSDLGVFEQCAQRRWKFGVNLNLHAKAYVFDTTMFVGSGNLTGAGLGFHSAPNQELGVMMKNPKINDIDNLHRFEEEVCWLDENLFAQFKEALVEIRETSLGSSGLDAWPIDLMERLRRPVESLWVSDLESAMPWFEHDYHSSQTGNSESNDLGSYGRPLWPELRESFLNSRLYIWLLRELKEATGYTNFGWLTARLQSSLIDDPQPTRKEVKEFTAIIFDWLEKVNPPDIELRSFTRTRDIVLKK